MPQNNLKYYEVKKPYYALIAAESETEAKAIYVKLVCDDEDDKLKDELKEVGENYALGRYSKAYGDSDILVKDMLKEFKTKGVLLIDALLE